MKGITTHTGIVAMALAVGMSFAGCEWVFPDLVDGNGPTGDASNTGDGLVLQDGALEDGSAPVDGALTSPCDDAAANTIGQMNSIGMFENNMTTVDVDLWPVQPGDLLVIAVSLAVSGPPHVTDTNGNSFQTAVGPVNAEGSWNYILYAQGAKGASGDASVDDQLTVVSNALSGSFHVFAAEFSGVKASNALDVHTGLPTTATAIDGGFLMQTGGLTTSPVELVFGYATVPGPGVSLTTGSHFRNLWTQETNFIEYEIVTCEGLVYATATASSPVGAILMATFKAQ